MTRPAEFVCAAAIAAALFASAPAKAQFAGIDENQMQQFAPMLEMMKQQMGKHRFAQLMKTMGRMMEKMQGQGGLGSMDMGQMMSMLGSMKGPPWATATAIATAATPGPRRGRAS